MTMPMETRGARTAPILRLSLWLVTGLLLCGMTTGAAACGGQYAYLRASPMSTTLPYGGQVAIALSFTKYSAPGCIIDVQQDPGDANFGRCGTGTPAHFLTYIESLTTAPGVNPATDAFNVSGNDTYGTAAQTCRFPFALVQYDKGVMSIIARVQVDVLTQPVPP